MASPTCTSTRSNTTTRNWGEQLVFMHAVKEGPADRSFGLQVAALAGLPKAVIAEARQTLASLERFGHPGAIAKPYGPAGKAAPQADLFAPAPDPELAALARELDALDPDALTPREALDWLYRLKQRVKP